MQRVATMSRPDKKKKGKSAWNVGNIAIEAAEELVLGSGQGDYIIRKGDDDIYTLMLHDSGKISAHHDRSMATKRQGTASILPRVSR